MSIFTFARILRQTAFLIALAGTAATARAQLPNLYGMPDARERTVFVPPKTVVRIKDRGVFVKGSSRSMTIFVSSPTALSDTGRLATEAKAVIVAEAPMIERAGATALAVAFQSPAEEITVRGVTPMMPTSVWFVRDQNGEWQPRKVPPRKIGLTVVPGRP